MYSNRYAESRDPIVAGTRRFMCCSDRCGGRTFGARKDTLLGARSDSTVELGGESLVADAIELVVRMNVLLDGLAAVVNTLQSA